MSPSQTVRSKSKRRAGFTIVELLIVMAILGLLVSLLLPAVLLVRESARPAQCLDRLKSLSLAVQNFASGHQDQFPYLTTGMLTSGQNRGGFALNYSKAGEPSPVMAEAPWTIPLLPHLDHERLYGQLQSADGDKTLGLDTVTLAQTQLEFFNCPSDPGADAPGNLSYVANGGYATREFWSNSDSTDHRLAAYSWPYSANPQETMSVTFATGVFWREAGAGASGRPMKLDTISRGDGLSNCLMFSENVNVRPYVAPGVGGWASQQTSDLAFLIAFAQGDASAQFSPLTDSTIDGIGNSSKREALSLRNGGATFHFVDGVDPLASTGAARINGNLELAIDGASPRPSSLHSNGVNVMFCDGHGGALSEDVDDLVYASLVSSSGGTYGQDIIGDDEF